MPMLMIRTKKHVISIMVLYAISLHLVWATTCAFDPDSVNATAIFALYKHVQSPLLLSWVLYIVAGCAITGLFTRVPWIVLLLVPQQIALMWSASGAVEAIWLAHFADGVIRSRGFLTNDQCYSILAAFWHTVAIIAHAMSLGDPPSDLRFR